TRHRAVKPATVGGLRCANPPYLPKARLNPRRCHSKHWPGKMHSPGSPPRGSDYNSTQCDMRREETSMKERCRSETERVAGNGLLHRRMFLAGGAAAMGAGAVVDQAGAAPLDVEPWMKIPGAPFNGYGQPSKYEEKVARTWASAPGTTGTGSSRTPHHLLNGMITPSGLHYERSHSGIPDIDPDTHRLVIHGLVKRPLVFTLDDLGRYLMQSRIAFVECAGNSGALFAKQPAQANVQAIHGLLSCSEWTGVMLSVLLQEAGVEPTAKWVLAEGADAAGMSRSFPIEKALDD